MSSKFGDKRFYKLATFTTNVEGKEVPLVTIQLEAFGITALANFTPKWTAIASQKAQHGQGWKVPTNKQGPNAKYHASLWSSGSQGKSNKGLGGWSQDAYKDWYKNQEIIDAIRKKDKDQNWKMYTTGRYLMRKHHNVEAQEPPHKKQKTTKEGGLAKHKEEEEAPVKPKLSNTVFKADEEEDHFSVHSECSSGENGGGAQVDVTATDEDGKAVAATIA